jgi:hypothetical protein
MSDRFLEQGINVIIIIIIIIIIIFFFFAKLVKNADGDETRNFQHGPENKEHSSESGSILGLGAYPLRQSTSNVTSLSKL